MSEWFYYSDWQDAESACMFMNKWKTKNLEKCCPELRLGYEDACMLSIQCRLENGENNCGMAWHQEATASTYMKNWKRKKKWCPELRWSCGYTCIVCADCKIRNKRSRSYRDLHAAVVCNSETFIEEVVLEGGVLEGTITKL